MTDVVFYGLTEYVGRTVGVFCVGLDLGDHVVAADGSVSVAYQSDVDGLFTADRIASVAAEGKDWGVLATRITISAVTYVVPACVGFRYGSRGQIPRPGAEGEIKSSQGSGLGKPRQVNQMAALLNSAVGVSFGVSFDEMIPAIFTDAAGAPLDHATMFSGVHQMSITPDRGKYDCELCWEITGAFPCVVVSITGFLHTEEPG